MFENTINAWRNASLTSADLEMKAEIGARETIIVGGWWSNILKFGNEVVVKPASMLWAAMPLVTVEAKAPKPMPEIPAVFKGTPLGENLARAYTQKCDSVEAAAQSAQCLANLDISGYKKQKSLAAHNAALNNVSLPENVLRSSSSDIGIGTAIGGLVANIPPEVRAELGNAALQKARAVLS